MARPTNAIRLRDPFVLPCPREGRYYLYGTTDEDCWGPRGTGFDAFRSADLRSWEGPMAVFRPPEGFWGKQHFWAPEVYPHRSGYIMFASFKAPGRKRGTQILRADGPTGPFRPVGDGPVTPPDWESLDGTLHFEEEGEPWMVFCREWTEVGDGRIAAMPLRDDLSGRAGPPVTLFAASSAPWSRSPKGRPGVRVTDGPWLHRHRDGTLLMLWSTIGVEGYILGCSRSLSGSVRGPWEPLAEPLFSRDGGHAMIFRRFDGACMLALHRPNRAPLERPAFFVLREEAGGNLTLDSDEF